MKQKNNGMIRDRGEDGERPQGGKMKNHECLTCGAELVHFLSAKEMKCDRCGQTFLSNIGCAEGHYICDRCHASLGIEDVFARCGRSRSKNPFEIVKEAMDSEFIHMHGNEHHVLVGSALLTAYANSGGELDLGKALSEMKSRGSKVPGGSCGFWGACGAAVSAGMYMSIVTGATPLTEESWGYANRMTSLALARMADIGGPRCCKRNSFIAIETAIALTENLLGVQMEAPSAIACTYSDRNNQCIRSRCPYYSG